MIRTEAVAGTWYPGRAEVLGPEIDALLAAADPAPAGTIDALVAPHAGLMFSGRTGASAYQAAARGAYDVIVLVGPSHFAAFDGVALFPHGVFATPLGPVPVDEAGAGAILSSPVVHAMPQVHGREHSLELQLPFVRRLFPDVPIVPLLIGSQRREVIVSLGESLGTAFGARRALLVASSDLSHYFDARTAATLDGRVQDYVAALDAGGLLDYYESYPEFERGRYVACGGGAVIAVMHAARMLGATGARILSYAHSGEVSGDHDGVVGYLAAAMGRFEEPVA